MTEYSISLHEVIKLHEILNQKTLCASKASAMKNIVQDKALKDLLDFDLKDTLQQIQDIQAVLRANIQ